jgi:hypothetical protein
VNADERQEIAASIAAHAELGPQYEAAVAEGLVERIGEEIDKRVDARLRGDGHQARSPQPTTPPQGQLAPPVQQGPARRGAGATVAGVFLALASMGLGVGATAVIAINVTNAGAQVVIILLVWVAIIMVNGIYARSYWPEGTLHRRGR